MRKALLILGGLVTGLATGLFGGGGGMLAVPLLTSVGRKKGQIAHATAIAVILPLTIVSSVVYIASGSFDTGIGFYIMGGVILGGILGSLFLKKMNGKALGIIFSVIMLAAGIKLCL